MVPEKSPKSEQFWGGDQRTSMTTKLERGLLGQRDEEDERQEEEYDSEIRGEYN